MFDCYIHKACVSTDVCMQWFRYHLYSISFQISSMVQCNSDILYLSLLADHMPPLFSSPPIMCRDWLFIGGCIWWFDPFSSGFSWKQGMTPFLMKYMLYEINFCESLSFQESVYIHDMALVFYYNNLEIIHLPRLIYLLSHLVVIACGRNHLILLG